MMTRRPIGIVYDCDGTFIDSQHHIVSGFNQAFGAANKTPPKRENIMSIIGLSLNEAVKRMAPDLSDQECDTIISAYVNKFRQQVRSETEPMYAGAKAHFERMKATGFYHLGVATGKSKRGLNRIVAEHNLEPFFASLQTSDFHPSKPSPAMLNAALDDFGIEAEHSVMIGDTTYDMLMGKAAGTRTIGVNWGYHDRATLAETEPDAIVNSFDEIEAVLESWFAR